MGDQNVFCPNCGNRMSDNPVQQHTEAAPAFHGSNTEESTIRRPFQHQQLADADADAPVFQTSFRPQTSRETNPAAELIEKAKGFNFKKLLIPGIALLVVVALVIGAFAIFGSAYKRPIDDQMDMLVGKASKTQVKRMYPTEVWEYYEEEWDMDFEDQYEEYEDGVDDIQDELEDEYGKNVKVSYKVTDKDEWDEDDLDELRDRLHDTYGIKKKSIKKAFEVEVDMTIKGSEDKDNEETTFDVVKIGNTWYLLTF